MQYSSPAQPVLRPHSSSASISLPASAPVLALPASGAAPPVPVVDVPPVLVPVLVLPPELPVVALPDVVLVLPPLPLGAALATGPLAAPDDDEPALGAGP